MIFDEKSSVYEVYRNIRSQIVFSKEYENIKTILITSYQENEGKTTVACNLATALSNIDKKVILIDGDLRDSDSHIMLKSKNDVGISDILKDSADYNIYKTRINDNLDLLSSGKKSETPSEIISSKFMKNIIEQAKDEYDYVFIDSHSLSLTSDASVLSTYCDGTILVCGCGEVELENVKKSKQTLMNMGSTILGVILNKFE